MSLRMAPPLPLILLLMIPKVSSAGGWSVTHSSSHICALEGSSVVMPCTYTFPPGHQIKKSIWTKTILGTGKEPPDLFNDPEYTHRIRYVGDKQHDCSITLTHARLSDSHQYYFRFITNVTNGKYTGKSGVTLTVTDLQVETSKKVKEGNRVSLMCKTICSLTGASFVWLKNMKPLSKRTDRNKLILPSVKREDTGIYSCGVRGHDIISPEYRLDVTYPPEKTRVEVNPSGVIVEGDSVTLTCSSESNPPADISWFKGEASVRSGNIYKIPRIRSDHSGEYKCKVFNDCGWRYSNAVILNVTYAPRNVSASMNSSSGVIVEGDSVTLTCSSESNPPVVIYSWFKENQTSSVGSGQSFRPLESGWFYCEAQNEVGSQRSAAVEVIFDGVKHALLYSIAGVISGLGGLFLILIILVVCKKSQRSSNIREEQANDTAYEDKMCDDHSENIYTNFLPACSVSESVCDSPADDDCDYDIYKNFNPAHMPSEEIYCTPDVPYDDPSEAIYINPDMCMH